MIVVVLFNTYVVLLLLLQILNHQLSEINLIILQYHFFLELAYGIIQIDNELFL